MSRTALILIDFLNDFTFKDGEKLARRALPAARATAGLRERFHKKGYPVIYANDNLGRWRSDFRHIFARCSAPSSRGHAIARTLQPSATDHFVLKPKNSAFFESPLDSLLNYLRVRRLILTGLSVESCVLFTANDAYLREYAVTIPQDYVAGRNRICERRALAYFGEILKVDTRKAAGVRI